jgi:hypothetical protein
VKKFFKNNIVSLVKIQIYRNLIFFRKYLGTRVIWAFIEIFNDNLTVVTLKGKKLHPDDIQGIRDFAMAYKDLATFAMTYKELTLYPKPSHTLFSQDPISDAY